MIGKSVIVVNQAVIESSLERGDDLIFFSVQEKPHYTTFWLVKRVYYRTANRHRWVGREDSGERETED